jgi:ATP-dependent DNA helicase DinG
MEDRVREFFGPTGALAQRLPGYECRPQQVAMAVTVARALESESRAVIEAGTGTGKTLAYLVPAVLSGKKVLVSTATKNLQEQIFYKDIPFLESLGFELEATYLKGRSNYLCRFRLDDFLRNPTFRGLDDHKQLRSLLDWVRTTETGDRAELATLPEDFPTWLDLSTTSDACLGSECPHFNTCFITQVRRKAAKAQIVIVNHHLFFADLVVRDGGFGEVLPKVDAVVFDEAHHLEESATSFFGRTLTVWRLRDLIGDVTRAVRAVSPPPATVYERLDRVRDGADGLFRRLALCLPPGQRVELERVVTEDPELQVASKTLGDALDRLGEAAGTTTELGEVAYALKRRCVEAASDLRFVLGAQDSAWVYLAERRGRSDIPAVEARPIDLTSFFTDLLYPAHRTTIFTSATLAVDDRFDYFRARIALGLGEPVAEQQLEAAFDYMEQSLLYVPTDLPEPSAPDFAERLVPTIEALIALTRGRAFVLFTSYRNLHIVREQLAERLPYPLLVQGERSRSALLESFKAEPSVLLGTSSFWEGVDVQGDKLSLVIIDKLPFASPADPVVRARLRYLREQGGDPFRHHQLPQAAIALKQGFGRLIRHREDVGIVAILDRRLLERAYGPLFLATLPRARRTRDFEVVRRWWDSRQATPTAERSLQPQKPAPTKAPGRFAIDRAAGDD